MRISEAIEGFLYAKSVECSLNTVADYRNTLRQWADFLGADSDVDALEPHDVQRFLYFLQHERGLKAKTVKNAHTGISSFFTWVEQTLGVPHLIRGRVRSPRANQPEIIPLSKRDLRDLLAACERSALWESTRREPATSLRGTRVRDRAIMLFLVDTGVRVQELCDLKIEDANLAGEQAQVRKGKGGKGRTVYFGQVVRQALWRYLNDRRFKEPHDPLFASRRGGNLDRHAVRKMLRAAGKRADIPEPVTPHRFRHTFSITYLRNGGDVFTLQKLLGHSSMEMVRRYLAIAQVDVADAHKRASPADNWRLG